MRRLVLRRLFVLGVLVWLAGVTSARDLLHTHSIFAERQDCPACRFERASGTTPATSAVVVAALAPVVVGPAPAPRDAEFRSSESSNELQTRGPPFSC